MENRISLKGKTLKGLFWSFTDTLSTHGIQFFVQIILARLLLPEHFGAIGIILIFIAISNTIINSGFSEALIRDQHTSQIDYSTAFYFNVIMSVVMYLLLFLSAYPISIFFKEPQLIIILRVLSIAVIINALGMVQRVILEKKVDFKTITKVNVISVIVAGIITIVAAFMGYGVWSLVINSIVMQFTETFCLWVFNKWIPSLRFSIYSFIKFYRFGYKLLLSGLIDTLYNNIYYIIIGRFYSTIQLGYYTNAVRFSDLASQIITTSLQRVSYPILSSIRNDTARLKAWFKKLIKISAFINFPIMVGLAAIANPLFSFLFGEKWLPAVGYFQLLCIAGMLYPLHAINLNILQVKGRTDLFLKIEVYKKISLTILIILSLFLGLGIIGIIGSAVLNSFLSLFINTYYSAKEIGYSTRQQIKDILPIFLISTLMGGSVYFVGEGINASYLLKLPIQVLLGCLLYFILSKTLRIQELNELIQMTVQLFKKMKRPKDAVLNQRL